MVRADLLDQNCWPKWPQWVCYTANSAGLASTAMWFLVLLPQVIKNWWRGSVAGLSLLWAVANFTASLVNLFFAFSVDLPLYVRVSAVYMPILEITILGQFMLYSRKPLTTRLLMLLICLLLWGTIVELELNFPESREKIQWVAIALWSIETFPQVILNIKLRSTSGQATTSVFIALAGKTTDFLVTYGLRMPLPYVVMCYFSSSSSFINGFQVFLYGTESWLTVPSDDTYGEKESTNGDKDEETKLLNDTVTTLDQTPSRCPSDAHSCYRTRHHKRSCRYRTITCIRCASMLYISVGLMVFAVGFFWRTYTFVAILGPLACFLIVFSASEYYNLKRKGRFKRCETAEERLTDAILNCGFGHDNSKSVSNSDPPGIIQ